MRIAVFGSGGVGGYFGGRLAQTGEEVIFIARGAHLAAMQAKGLLVESVLGNFTLQPVHATNDPRRVGPVDVVFVCVKAWQVSQAGVAMQPMVGPDTVVIPLENGVEAPDELAAVLETPGEPFRHVVGGLCRISSHVTEPGHICHVSIEPTIAFGRLDGKPDPRLEKLRQAFASAGVKAEIPGDIQAACWMKFVFIAAIGGLGAITRSPVGVFRALPETRQMLVQALEEIAAVGQAQHVALPSDAVQRTLTLIDKLPGNALPSMQRDLMSGKPSELEAQNGAVMRMGRAVGIPTPMNTFIYNSLLPLERLARGELEF